VARSFIVYQGEDELPEFDLTDPESNVHVIFEEVEAGGRAYRGESNSSSIPMRDQRGETGNEEDLPGALTHVSLSRGSRWVWRDGTDDVIMATGRIGPKSYSRGRQKADRAREVIVEAADRNEELTDIIVDDWVRPEETDVERILALITDYLSGTPRATTNIAPTYVSAENPVTMPAKTYDGTDPKGVFDECATMANKNFFITVDDEAWYDSYDSLTYPAGVRISDRPDEWNTEGTCDEATGFLGAGCSVAGTNFDSDLAAWAGDKEERAAIETAFAVVAGDTLVAWCTDVQEGHDVDHTVYDEQGNTWTLDGTGPAAGTVDRRIEIWRCNVTNPLAAGDYIRFAFNLGASLVSSNETGGRCIGVYAFPGTLDTPVVSAGTFSNGGLDPAGLLAEEDPTSSGDVVVVGAAIPGNSSGDTRVVTPDPDWEVAIPWTKIGGSGNLAQGVLGQFLEPGAGEGWSAAISQSASWSTISVGYTHSGSSEGASLPTFPPKWDVGDASREDGLELISGLRLYYGQDGAYVTASDPTTEAEYWHAERSFYTSDPAIDTSGKAQVMADAILQRLKFEDRTYSCSIGPLNDDQVGCIKYGQLLYIKARAIPDADDQFRPRRIAQLRWTSPRPGVFWARLQLDRPLKEVPYGVGPKTAHDALELHKEGDSHPASAIVITDAGAYFAGTDVEAALQELGASGGGAHDHDIIDVTSNVVDHGTMGAAETFDFSAGVDHEGVLDQNLTLTLTGATNGEAAWMTLKLTQDGTGTNTIDLPASVVNASDVEGAFDTAANAVNIISVFTYDGGSTWYAFLAGGGTSVGALDDLSDVTITAPAAADRLRYNDSGWVNSALRWSPVMTFDGTNWLVVVDGDGNPVLTEV
jgi:hypothetical protein